MEIGEFLCLFFCSYMSACLHLGKSWYDVPSVVKRLAEDCCKYGVDNEHFGFALAKSSVEFGNSHKQIEKEREDLLKVLGEQVMANFHLLI